MGDTKQVIRLRHAWVVWGLFGLFSACLLYARGFAAGHPVPFASALLLGLFDAHLYLLATLPVFSLAARFPPGVGDRAARVLLYVLGSLLFSAAIATAQSAFHLWLGEAAGAGGVVPYRFASGVLDRFGEGLFVYWLAVLAPYASSRHVGRGRDALDQSHPEDGPAYLRSSKLRAQLRPHFLFNTLNSVAALMHEDVKAAESLLMSTSAFLRGALSESREVSLRFELDTLEGYLHMEAAGFEGELSVRVDVEPSVEQALVPNMLLLPLAGHAVRSDSAPQAVSRRVEVEARREGDRLCIQLRGDSGEGVAAGASPREGGGLARTAARLSQFYGTRHRFEARYSPDAGFLAEIEIPFRAHRPATEIAGVADVSVTGGPSARS